MKSQAEIKMDASQKQLEKMLESSGNVMLEFQKKFEKLITDHCLSQPDHTEWLFKQHFGVSWNACKLFALNNGWLLTGSSSDDPLRLMNPHGVIVSSANQTKKRKTSDSQKLPQAKKLKPEINSTDTTTKKLYEAFTFEPIPALNEMTIEEFVNKLRLLLRKKITAKISYEKLFYRHYGITLDQGRTFAEKHKWLLDGGIKNYPLCLYNPDGKLILSPKIVSDEIKREQKDKKPVGKSIKNPIIFEEKTKPSDNDLHLTQAHMLVEPDPLSEDYEYIPPIERYNLLIGEDNNDLAIAKHKLQDAAGKYKIYGENWAQNLFHKENKGAQSTTQSTSLHYYCK